MLTGAELSKALAVYAIPEGFALDLSVSLSRYRQLVTITGPGRMHRVGDNLNHFHLNETIVSVFIGRGVEFVLVGGLAVSWYCKEREARDLDLLLNPTAQNSARVVSVLVSLGIDMFDGSHFTQHAQRTSINKLYDVDLLTPLAQGPAYGDVAATSERAHLFNYPIIVASPEMLIRMKYQAVSSAQAEREKHLADIDLLKSHVG